MHVVDGGVAGMSSGVSGRGVTEVSLGELGSYERNNGKEKNSVSHLWQRSFTANQLFAGLVE